MNGHTDGKNITNSTNLTTTIHVTPSNKSNHRCFVIISLIFITALVGFICFALTYWLFLPVKNKQDQLVQLEGTVVSSNVLNISKSFDCDCVTVTLDQYGASFQACNTCIEKCTLPLVTFEFQLSPNPSFNRSMFFDVICCDFYDANYDLDPTLCIYNKTHIPTQQQIIDYQQNIFRVLYPLGSVRTCVLNPSDNYSLFPFDNQDYKSEMSNKLATTIILSIFASAIACISCMGLLTSYKRYF